MYGNFAWFLTLAVFSGLSMNLILRFGIGLQWIAMEEGDSLLNSEKNAKWAFLFRWGIYFVSVMLLWLFFSILQSVVFLGFLEYILIFPVSFLFFTAIENLAARLAVKTNRKGEIVSRNRFISDYFSGDRLKTGGGAPVSGAMVDGAPAGAALFVILGLAGSFAQAAMLSFGFSAGAALAVLIVGEIRRRSGMEAVQRYLRGAPLVLIAMGLLSLVIISAATVFYSVLGVE